MHYSNIKNYDIANGSGVRVSLFVSGCRNHCKNCFQPETWDFSHGEPFTEDTAEEIIAMLDKSYIDGLTLLGGEPFEPENQVELVRFLKSVKERLPEKNVWAFTGFTFEELFEEECRGRCEVTDELLSMIDVLVDGRYVDELRDITLKFRGSSNQRLIDVKETFEAGEVVLID